MGDKKDLRLFNQWVYYSLQIYTFFFSYRLTHMCITIQSNNTISCRNQFFTLTSSFSFPYILWCYWIYHLSECIYIISLYVCVLLARTKTFSVRLQLFIYYFQAKKTTKNQKWTRNFIMKLFCYKKRLFSI